MRGRLPRMPAAFDAVAARDGRHTRWDDHREERRRLIIDAALAVVEESPVGAELRLQDVAVRAGLVRTVVQRHFGDRTGLVRAVQADALAQAFGLINAPVDVTATLREVAAQVLGVAVDWVDQHPALHALVERELGDGERSELSRAIDGYAAFLVQIPAGVAELRGTPLADDVLDEIRLVFAGVIGQVRATVAHWVGQEPRTLDRDRVVDVLVAAVVGQIAERGTVYGLDLDPDSPLLVEP